MSKLLAIEWDSREIRLAAGRVSGKAVVVEETLAVELPEEAAPKSPQEVGRQLAEVCHARGLGHCPVLVSVPRAKTELRVLQVPDAPDEELPELVRFQAMRQFATLGEDWPLDYVPLASGDAQQRRVLAATISPQLATDFQQVCSAVVGHDARLVLRPCASASLYGRRAADHRCRLLVELFAEDADLNVVVDGQVVFLRSVRLPSANLATSLVGEIRRTLAAAQNQLGDQRIEGVTLVGNAAELAEIQPVLETRLEQAIEGFDPFSQVQVSSPAQQRPPDHPGRYASLLGMLLDEAEGRRHGIDFLNPRRRPEPPNRGRRYVWVGVAAAALLLLLSGSFWWRIAQYDAQIADLRTQNDGWDEQVSQAEQLKADVGTIDQFERGNVNWLDQIYDISRRLPESDQAMVDTATFTAMPGGGGQISLDGYVSDPDVIKDMEEDLRDEVHRVTGAGTFFDERQEELRWAFKEQIVVLPEAQQETAEDE